MKKFVKKAVKIAGGDPGRVKVGLSAWSIRQALREQGLAKEVEKLRLIVPDVSRQYTRPSPWSGYWELKMRGMHAFQCQLMLQAINSLPEKDFTVVDIGDSAGTHMLYLRELAKDKGNIETISVNLDSQAIDRIRKRGLRAILSRAEEVDLPGEQVDLFVSFEMVEHLHNPAIFFRRLAKKSTCNHMLITVPYLRTSRVGLYQVRHEMTENLYAEDEHIFELSPGDWTLLMRHAGWKVVQSRIYYQYPRKWPGLAQLMASFWRHTDFEGFWGAILEKETTFSDRYLDWES